jgi:hypothetical protein
VRTPSEKLVVEVDLVLSEMGGGIGIVEILHSSNIIAMTGGGRYPLYSLKKLIIWDDDECQRKAEIVMKSEIKAVKIKLD